MFKEVFAAATQLHFLPVGALVIFFVLSLLLVAWVFRPGSSAFYAKAQQSTFDDERDISHGKRKQ